MICPLGNVELDGTVAAPDPENACPMGTGYPSKSFGEDMMAALDSDSTLSCEGSFALMLASSASNALIVGVGWIHAVGSLVAYVGRAGARQAEQGKGSDSLQENPISAIGLPEITKSVSNV
jgi:hypothetical protein